MVQSRLTPSSIVTERVYDCDNGILKSVRWRDDQMFALGGNERQLLLMDQRAANPLVTSIKAHNAAVRPSRCVRETTE